MAKAREIFEFLKQVVREFTEDDCMTMAASLAYYTVFSAAPLLLIVIVVAGLFLTPDEASRAVDNELRGLIGQEGAEQLGIMVQHVQRDQGGNLLARILGTVIVLFGATGVMVQLQAALNRAWDVMPDPNQGGIRRFVGKRLLSFGLILALAFLLLVSLALTAILAAIATTASNLLPDGISDFALQSVNFVVSFLVVALLFAAIYKFMPEAKIKWRDVAVGAGITSLLFSIGKALIGIYLGQSNIASAYGAAGSLAVVFVWVYYSAVIVLLGAEFTQVWTKRYGGGLIVPEHGAVVASEHRRATGQP